MAYQLILSTDTLDQGRIKINNFFNDGVGLVSAGTGTNSILTTGGYNTNNGNYSFVTGKRNTIGSGSFSSILGGSGNTFGGSQFTTIVGGFRNRVLGGSYSTVLGGLDNTTYNRFSTNLGGANNFLAGYYSTCLGGKNNKTYGYTSGNIIGGINNYIYGNDCVLVGGKNNTIGSSLTYASILGGRNNTIVSNYSAILGGTGNRVEHQASIVLGTGGISKFSNSFTFAANGITQTPLGTNNRFRIQSNGNTTMNGTLTQNGAADYAEYFEWEDKNLNNEDRTGFFVSLNKDKIKIDNSNIIGIVSARPCIVGDGAEEFWSELHKKDIWGREIYEYYTGYTLINKKETKNFKLYFIGADGKIYSELPSSINIKGTLSSDVNLNDLDINNSGQVFEINVYNENYDPNHEYIPRSKRKEWAAIGLLGKLYVRTSEKITSTKIDVGSDGRAKNGTKYHVLKTVKEFDGDFGIVQILFK
jgi:hypothetical protein